MNLIYVFLTTFFVPSPTEAVHVLCEFYKISLLDFGPVKKQMFDHFALLRDNMQ
jgi:hypothetical protein